ncbi:hypothetical protein C7431_103388 [Pantoea allii]|uniref:Uncharacterized protein n=1 Tax=Pantoea allii TaxID=574096 RepID=A0A2V2BIP3_9GAMM|nr:hypothetical protein C7431_103388 [Pantoea allii]
MPPKTYACEIECFPGRLASPVVNMRNQNSGRESLTNMKK